jgi:hypothetical protein
MMHNTDRAFDKTMETIVCIFFLEEESKIWIYFLTVKINLLLEK